ncbi:MAG: DUF2513 domain-containing protein [Formivibrio sp.]|nr:DUF2513 domain-containing protein [Formivibrio sp.]
MKRDWDLLRKQLTDIEDEKNVLEDIPDEPKWSTQTADEYEQQLKEYTANVSRIAGHLEMLINNGYVEGVHVSRGMDGHFSYGLSGPRLTMAGHDLLDTMRSTTMWETIKATAKSKGAELTFDVIKTIGAHVLAKMFQ